MSAEIVQVNDLTRIFTVRDKRTPKAHWFAKPLTKELTAVSNLNFAIQTGEKVAFIGPNGAGKSTTLKMLSGLLRPTSGLARVCDIVPWDDVKLLARQIGLVFGQKTHLWPMLSVSDSFDLLAKIYDLDLATYRRQRDKLIEVFGLQTFVSQYARSLSLGQKMRSDIAAALLHQPSVLFLDEPTIGLDVTAKAMLRDHLNKLVQEFEITVLLTSHDTDDIEKICDRVILIDHGQKLLDTTLPSLHQEHTHTKTLSLLTEEAHPVFSHPHVAVEEEGEHRLVLKVDVTQTSIEKIVALCLDQFTLRDIGIEDLPLEEIIKAIYAKNVCVL
ncbi:MAG: ATP-binding cassette domain-containing protein [Alphaproteobacteria bacterium]|nr:ATP-binding cassette domain-containing protein [Alphaproteobacteria bacterium]